MDNHLAAAWCWMQECNPYEEYNFIHIDQHSDLKGCGHPKDIEFLKNNPHISFGEYTQMTYKNMYEYHFFQWDNYIRVCHYLFPQWFNTNLFYTYDDNETSANEWGYDMFPTQSRDPLLLRQEITRYIKNADNISKDDTVNNKNKDMKWIFNLDLDFFWDEDGKKLYDNKFILDLGEIINQSMTNIQVITIALSPDCIGGENMRDKWQNVIRVFNILKKAIRGLESCPL